MQIAPGNPAIAVLSENNTPSESGNLSETDWNRRHGLDKPLFMFSISGLSPEKSSWKYWIPSLTYNKDNRFTTWLSGDEVNQNGILNGDFGHSFRNEQPVMEIIAPRISNTFILSVSGILLSYLIGIPLGLVVTN
ncbi:MAG: hypothetical protein ACKOA1_05810, partial [Bacteroidota bacterium]